MRLFSETFSVLCFFSFNLNLAFFALFVLPLFFCLNYDCYYKLSYFFLFFISRIGKSMGKKASKQAAVSSNGDSHDPNEESVWKSGDFTNIGPGVTLSTISSVQNGNKSLCSSGSNQDSAINELLEGRMKLTINIVHRNEQLVISVERRTPLLDLLVQIATQFHFNAADYVIRVDEDAPNALVREYKASTPIGVLDVNKVSVVAKAEKKGTIKSVSAIKSSTFSRQQSAPAELPFKPTIRLQVNLPHNQLMVLRLMPNVGISDIKQLICKEKSVDESKYLLVKPFKSGQTPMVLDLDNPLDFYQINEVTLLSNKTFQELSKQFSSSNCNHFASSMYDEGSNRLGDQTDLSQSTPNIAKFNGMYKRSVSESQGDLSSLKRADPAARTGKTFKNKPAPPPPLKSAKSAQNLAPIRDEDEERPASVEYSSYEHHDSSFLSEHSGPTVASKLPPEGDIIRQQPSKNRLSRQNSGSDSSGYHEMLSHAETNTPTDCNSPAPPLSLSPNPSEACSLVNQKEAPVGPPVPSQRTSLSSKTLSGSKAPAPRPPGRASSTASKKRRAPLPPSTSQQSNDVQSQRIVDFSSFTEPNFRSLPSKEVDSTASSTSSASSSAFEESVMTSTLHSKSQSPIVIIKSSITETSAESLNEPPIDETGNQSMNSTVIPQTDSSVSKSTLETLDESNVPETAVHIEPIQPEPENMHHEILPKVVPPLDPKPESGTQPVELSEQVQRDADPPRGMYFVCLFATRGVGLFVFTLWNFLYNGRVATPLAQ